MQCYKCGKSGHGHRTCKAPETKCEVCGDRHHTSVHDLVTRINEKLAARSGLRLAEGSRSSGQAAIKAYTGSLGRSLSTADYQGYQAMVEYCSEHPEPLEDDLEDINLQALMASMQRFDTEHDSEVSDHTLGGGAHITARMARLTKESGEEPDPSS